MSGYLYCVLFQLIALGAVILAKHHHDYHSDKEVDNKLATTERHRRAPRILCKNGSEINGACVCQQNFVGTHCEWQMHCRSFERKKDGSCLKCKDNFEGDRCERIICEHGKPDEYEQSCVCDKPFTGPHCTELKTGDVYYYFNSRVAKMGPLGAFILIPMFLIYYGCEHFAKKRQVRRIEKTWCDQTNISVDSDRIKHLLEEKA